MKRLLIIVAFFILGAYFISCQKGSLVSNENLTNTDQKTKRSFAYLDNVKEKFNHVITDNEARILSLGLDASRDCVQTAIVPDNYATIQEAIDAVCDNGNVIVKSGIYDEIGVVIYKPGLKIKAIGDVTLNGGFGIVDYIDDITIQNFNIDLTTSAFIVGIGGYFNNGFDIKQNNIYGSNHIGIYLSNCTNMSIKQNNVSGPMDYGIFIDAYYGDRRWGSCSSNNIAQNYVSGMVSTPGIGILLRGDNDFNVVQGNTVNSTTWGISLEGVNSVSEGSCDNNVIKNNVSNDNDENGIEIYMYVNPGAPIGKGPEGNTIGPNNEANVNGINGIHLWEYANNNHTFNNTALNNTNCDLVNEGLHNTFKKNTADCTIGID